MRSTGISATIQYSEGRGNRTIYGARSDYTLSGSLGNDVLFGNLGADLFVFGDSSGLDQIIGFSLTENDHITLQGQSYTTPDTGQGMEVDLSGSGINPFDKHLRGRFLDSFLHYDLTCVGQMKDCWRTA